MPAPHDLDPDWMSEEDRLAKRRYDAYFAFEQQLPLPSKEDDHDIQRVPRHEV